MKSLGCLIYFDKNLRTPNLTIFKNNVTKK